MNWVLFHILVIELQESYRALLLRVLQGLVVELKQLLLARLPLLLQFLLHLLDSFQFISNILLLFLLFTQVLAHITICQIRNLILISLLLIALNKH